MIIEEKVRDYLASELSVDVFCELPMNPPVSFVKIEKTSGGIDEHIRSGTIAVQSYADTLYNAALLNEQVIEKMLNIIELNEICKCTLNSDYNFTDTRTKKYRYQAVFNFIYY